MRKLTILLPPDWYDAFRRRAEASGKSVSQWLRELAVDDMPAAEAKRLSEIRRVGAPRKDG